MASLIITIFSSLSALCQTYKVVDTGVHEFYGDSTIISVPKPGDPFYGQDAAYQGNEPSYVNNGDGTVTDNVTGLMWQKDMGAKISYSAAFTKADTMTLGGFTDWRVPTIKELYSLILFTGRSGGTASVRKYIDSAYFNQPIGNTAIGEREIDAQTWSSTQYKGLTMAGDSTVFGVNFIDGRIKGYPKYQPGSGNTTPNTMYFRMVRGNFSYGINKFVNNGDGTIADNATGLMWQQADDGVARDWKSSLAYAENLTLASYSDWRLPNAKELQSIVDYTRSPSSTNSPAIDPLFSTTSIKDPNGTAGQYPYFWTSTTHLDGVNPYSPAVYIAFGKAQGKMNSTLLDVHGAGAQRSDPKYGNAADYPQYMGPQGDVRYVFNYVRCVRSSSRSTGAVEQQSSPSGFVLDQNFPNPFNPTTAVTYELTVTSRVRLVIYDMLGRELTVLKNEQMPRGTYTVTWNAADMPTGTYFCSLTTGSFSQTRRMMLMK
ncbi:MAG: DUF1566 domain-containing protein [Ignavibacteriales bacterium]|nr:DUF1566 domain-containing protein [Ignavibacteriales bacterium]